MYKSLYAIAIASALALGNTSLAHAQTDESGSESNLQEVTVSTTRLSETVANEPTKIDVIGAEEVGEETAMSPGDVSMLLNETSGLHVQMTSPGLGAANVRIEGLEGHYSQILADGLPLYGGQAGSTSLLQIPPLDLGQVEIMKGVASALYGASALGGVINFVSRRPDGQHEVLLNQTSRQETDAALWWAGPAAREGWSYSLLASGSRQTMQDVDGDGWADLPGYERAVFRPRLYWDDAAGREVYLTAGATLENRAGGTMADGRIPSGDPNGSSFLEALTTHRYDAGLTGRIPIDAVHTLTVRASFTDKILSQVIGEVYEPTQTRSALAETDLNGISGRNHWVIGAAFAQDSYGDKAFPDFDFDYRVPALLAEEEYHLSNAATLSASGRVDFHNRYGNFFSPRLAALWRLGGRSSPWRLRLAAGSGFFAPTPITEETEATGLARVLPLQGVRAERARGVSGDIDRFWNPSGSLLETDLAVFGSSIANALNLVQSRANPPRFAFENDPQPTRTFGSELVLRWRNGPFEAVATDTYVDSSELEPDETVRMPVPLNPKQRVSFTASWEPEELGRIGIEVFYTGRQSLTGTLTPNPYLTQSPGFFIFGLLLERQIGPAMVFLNGENLTDRRLTRYQPLILPARAADGQWTTDAWAPIDGRVINLGARWRFR